MAYIIGVSVVVLGVGLSLALHEVGHLLSARYFDVRCTQFMVGFGPRVWSRRFGETEYGLKAVPFGGYVRMLGMLPPRLGRPVGADSTGRWAQMIELARRDAQREVGPQDRDRLYYQRPVLARVVIMLSGPAVNLVLGVGLLALVLTCFGQAMTTTRLAAVSRCVLPATAPADRTCTPSDPLAPAALAGLRPDDRIVAFDGTAVRSWAEVRELVRANRGTTITLTVRRDGSLLETTVTPLLQERPVLGTDGHPVVGPDGRPRVQVVGFLGVVPRTELVRQPLSAVGPVAVEAVAQVAGTVLDLPQKMVGVAEAAFGSAPRDPNGPVSVVGVARFGGEIAAAEGGDGSPITVGDRVAGWLSLLAGLNLALAVFNLLPVLPLDGGQIAGALWEGLRRRWARLLDRPDPGPVDVARALPVTLVAATMLLGMSVLLVYADLVRPISQG